MLFAEFQTDPETELTRGRLENALNALAKIPVIGPDVIEAARPEVREKCSFQHWKGLFALGLIELSGVLLMKRY